MRNLPLAPAGGGAISDANDCVADSQNMQLVGHGIERDPVPSYAVLGHEQPIGRPQTSHEWLQLVGDLYGDGGYHATKPTRPRADLENPRRDFRLLDDGDANAGERSWQVACSSKHRLRGRAGHACREYGDDLAGSDADWAQRQITRSGNCASGVGDLARR